MIKLSEKKHGFGKPVRKIGMIFLLVTGSLVFCACDAGKQQTETTSVNAEDTATADALDDSVSSELKRALSEPKAVAKTIDAMQSPAISIQIQQAALTVPDEWTVDLESEADNSSESSPSEETVQKETVKKSPVKSTKKQQAAATVPDDAAASLVPGATTPIDAAASLVSGNPQADIVVPVQTPIADVNPTVNNSGESYASDSNVGYSQEDTQTAAESPPEDGSDIYANFE